MAQRPVYLHRGGFPDEASVSSDQDLLQLRHEPTLKLDQK